MQYPQFEQPVYVLSQNKKRVIIPRTITLLVLSAIFYLGILLNISLLDLNGKQETVVKTASLILLTIIILLGFFLALHRAKKKYKFYRKWISIGKKRINYSEITNTHPKQNITNKIFKTQSIHLNKKFIIKNIPCGINLQNYIEQMIEYAKSQEGLS
jgi:hypothetical protein